LSQLRKKLKVLILMPRHHLLEYDDVLNKHREINLQKRKEFLESENLKEKVLQIF